MTTKKPAPPKTKRTGADIKPAKNYGNTSFGKTKTGGGTAPAKTVIAKPMRKASSKGR